MRVLLVSANTERTTTLADPGQVIEYTFALPILKEHFTMQYTYLGRTGVKVSRLCLGCMSYGSTKWRPWVLDEQAAMPFFRKAIEAGINFFDTADVYSLGVSEEITGKALREFAKMEQVVLATKVFARMGDEPNMQGLSRKHIQQGCEASLRRLGVETIDLYQIHRFDPPRHWRKRFPPWTCWSGRARSAISVPVPWPHGSSPRPSRFRSGTVGRGLSPCRTTTI